MAERRMFTQKITESDAFTDMPPTSQNFYFHLNMSADDDGFVNNPKKIQRQISATDDDMKILIAKRFILPFESGVIVIKHWRMHNLLRKDRYTPTDYIDEKNRLYLKENGAYTFDQSQGVPLISATTWQPDGNQMAPQVRIGKDSIGKDSKDKKDITPDKPSAVKPEISEIINYLNIKLKARYSDKSKSTVSHITARLKEGRTVQDFKTVIDKKCAEWQNDSKMCIFLRPETLFCAEHFDSYLNQPVKPSKSQTNIQGIDEADEIREAIRRKNAGSI